MMHYWNLLWDWDNLDAVRAVHSFLEGWALVFFALLVIFDVLAHLAEENKQRAKTLERIGLVCFAVAVLAEGLAYPYSQRNDTLSERVIVSLSGLAGAADTKARQALGDSSAAITQSKKAVDASGHATTSASSALVLARGARQEADTFEKDIRTAKRDAAEAKALLSDARQLAAEAKQQAGEATVGVSQLKANRSLKNPGELSANLKKFGKTEYAFSGVFADEESIGLLMQINDALQRAGWQRVKGVHHFPALGLFGKDDDVGTIVTTGIFISVESPESLASLQALRLDKLPSPVNAAVALNAGLSSGIFPQDVNPKLVNVQMGTSKTVQISVGKKP